MNMTPEEIQNLSDSIGKSVAKYVRTPTLTSGGPTISPGGGGGFNAGGFASSLIESINPLSKLTTVTNGVVTAFSELAKGTYTVNDALTTTSGVLAQIPGVGNMLGNTLQKLGETALDYNDSLRQSSKNGAYFGNNLGEYAETVLGARMSLKEWNAMIERSAGGLNHLGLTMDQSSVRFLVMAKQMQELPLADVLRKSGMGLEEFNDYLNENLSRRKFIDFSDESTRKKSIDSAIQLATEMDNIARLTGMSRAEQMKAKEAIEERPDVQLLRAQLDIGQQATLDQMEAMTATMGPAAQRAFAEAATGGIRTKEGSVALAALGEAGPALLKATQAIQSTDVAERERGLKELEAAKDAYMRMHQDRDWQRQTMLGALSTDPVMQARARMFTEDREAAQRLQQEREAKRLGISVEELQKRIVTDISKSRMGVGPEGEPLAEAAPSRALNEAIGVTKDMMAGTGTILKDLNSELGSTISGFQGLNKYLRPYSQEESRELIETVKKTVSGAVGAIPTTAPGPGASGVAEEIKGIFKGKPIEPVTEIKRQGGSAEATGGKLLEDWGKETLVKLHGREGVITEEQLARMHENTKTAIGAIGKSTPNYGVTPSIPSEINISSASIDSLIKSIKGPVDDLGSRLEKLSSKDIDRLVSNDSARTELTSQLNSIYAGKPMTVEPIIEVVSAKLERSSIKAETREQERSNEIIKQIKSINEQSVIAPAPRPSINVTVPKTVANEKVTEPKTYEKVIDKNPEISSVVNTWLKNLDNKDNRVVDSLEKLDTTNKTIAPQIASNIAPSISATAEKITSSNTVNKEIRSQVYADLDNSLSKNFDQLTATTRSLSDKIEPVFATNLEKLGVTTYSSSKELGSQVANTFNSSLSTNLEKLGVTTYSSSKELGNVVSTNLGSIFTNGIEKIDTTSKTVGTQVSSQLLPQLTKLEPKTPAAEPKTTNVVREIRSKETIRTEVPAQFKDSSDKIETSVKSLVPEFKTMSADLATSKVKDTTDKTGVANTQIAESIRKLADIKPATTTVVKSVEPTGISEKFTSAMFDIGNFAGKQYDNITKIVSNTFAEISKTSDVIKTTSSTKVTDEGYKKTLAELGVTPMIGISKPESRPRYDTDLFENLGKQASEYYKKEPKFDLSDPFTKFALENEKSLKKAFPSATVERTIVKEPAPVKPSEEKITPKAPSPAPITVVVPKQPVSIVKTAETKIPTATTVTKPAPLITPKVSAPTETLESIKNLLNKSTEIAASGDEKRAKIYADAAERQREQLKTSLSGIVPVKAKTETSVASLGIGKDIASIKEKRDNLAYINETGLKKVSAPTETLESIKNLLNKSTEIAASGDEKRAKIYADAAERQREQLKTSLSGIVPVKAKTETSVASLGIGKDIASIKEKRDNLAYINETGLKEVSTQVQNVQNSVASKLAQDRANEPKTTDFETLVTKATTAKPAEPKEETPKVDTKIAEMTTMNDIKMELVMLNKNMRELIAHTYEVADTAKHQVRVTKKATTNNLLG